jgi:hypothetical protein
MEPVEGAALGLLSPSADGEDEHDDEDGGGGGGGIGGAPATPGGSKYAVYAKAARVLVGRAAHVGKEVGKVGLRHAAVGARAALKNVNSRLSGKVDMAEAMQRIERDARDARGEMRKSKLRAWCQVRLVLRPTALLPSSPPPASPPPLRSAVWRDHRVLQRARCLSSRVPPPGRTSPLVPQRLWGCELCCVFQHWAHPQQRKFSES